MTYIIIVIAASMIAIGASYMLGSGKLTDKEKEVVEVVEKDAEEVAIDLVEAELPIAKVAIEKKAQGADNS